MKAVQVILALVVAATALAYGRGDVAETIVSHASAANEPAALLLSGSALLALAGALRRLA